MDNIDKELFISLVEERDVLWDQTLETYKDKRKTLQAWRDICVILNEGFESLSDVERNKYEKLVLKKWKSMRDEWMKCHRKINECKSGSRSEANRTVHKYTYYDNMKFLLKIAKHRDTESNIQNVNRDDSPMVKKKKKGHVAKEKYLSVVDTRMIESTDSLKKEDSKNEDSRIMSFFKSIAPTVEKFSDEEVVEFQYQVISIVRNMKQKSTSASQITQLHELFQSQPTYNIQTYGYSTAAELANVRGQSRLKTNSSDLEFDTYTEIGPSQSSVQSSISEDLDIKTLD